MRLFLVTLVLVCQPCFSVKRRRNQISRLFGWDTGGGSNRESASDLQSDKARIAILEQQVKELQEKVAERDNTILSLKSPTTSTQKLRTQTKPFFCPNGMPEDLEKWVTERKALTKNSFDGDRYGNYGTTKSPWQIPPTYWCNKLQNNLKPWVKPKLSTDDLVVGVFTGESLFYGRASSTRDTWLMWFKHHYIFSAKAGSQCGCYPYLLLQHHQYHQNQ